MRASFRIERAAGGARAIHRAREPLGEQRAHAENGDEHEDIEQRIFHSL